MNVKCKANVKDKSDQVVLLEGNLFKVECHKNSFDIKTGDKIHVILTPEYEKDLFEQAEYVMIGKEIESAPNEENEKCISFGGLIGRFPIKDQKFREKWYLYVKKY
jgi:hypothetical protein